MASLRVYQNQSHSSGGGDGAVEMRGLRSNLGAWEEIPLDEQRIEVESVNTDINSTSIKVELLVIVDDNFGDESFDTLNNSFYFECNDEWITVIRNRNLITLLIRNNYSNEDRIGMISFYHNVSNINYVDDVAVENTINLSVVQLAHEYSVEVVDVDDVVTLESLPDGVEEKMFSVVSVGGREDFRVKKVKKFHRLIIQENAESEPKEYIKPVVYDNAFQIEYVFDEETKKRTGFKIINYGNINCNYTEKCLTEARKVYPLEVKECHPRNSTIRQLIVNDYYYEVSVYNVDCIDAVDMFIVKYDSGQEEKIPTTPQKNIMINARPPYQESFMPQKDYTNGLIEEIFICAKRGDMDCYNSLMEELANLIESYMNVQENEEQGSIVCNPDELIFEHTGGTSYSRVETVPEDSAVYAENYADFISSCTVEGDEIRITVKSNPYTTQRNCIVYLTNAMRPNATTKLLVTQKGKPDTTR